MTMNPARAGLDAEPQDRTADGVPEVRQAGTPAEERTGVSDRAAAALIDLAELRCETFRLWSAGTVGRRDGLARLDRIEAALRERA